MAVRPGYYRYIRHDFGNEIDKKESKHYYRCKDMVETDDIVEAVELKGVVKRIQSICRVLGP